MTDPRPLLRHEVVDGCAFIRLRGEIDLSNVDGLEAAIDSAVAEVRDAVIDLTAVDFIDSRGLRLLNRVSSSVAGRDGSLVVVAPPGSIARSVLDITGMSDELAVRDSA